MGSPLNNNVPEGISVHMSAGSIDLTKKYGIEQKTMKA